MRVADAEAEGRFGASPARRPCARGRRMPLLVEGDVVGLLVAGRAGPRHLHRRGAAARQGGGLLGRRGARRAQLLEQVRRYATLLEQVVEVDQRVFAARAPTRSPRRSSTERAASAATWRDAGPADAARARRGGDHRGGAFAGAVGRPAPAGPGLGGRAPPLRRTDAGRGRGARRGAAGRAGLPRAARDRRRLGGLPGAPRPDGESPDDRLLEAYASRRPRPIGHARRPARPAAEPVADPSRFPSRRGVRRLDGTTAALRH